VLGYDKVSEITAKALAEGTTPRDAAIALGYISGEDYDRNIDPHRMVGA
jgi:fumarate hydratase class II